MKTFQLLFSLLFVLLLATSCEKETPITGPVNDLLTNRFTAKINDVQWAGTSAAGILALNKLTITAFNINNNRTFNLLLPQDIVAGTYALSVLGEHVGQFNEGTTDMMISSSGNLVITDHDPVTKVIQGTFNFEATEVTGPASASISAGNFYVGY